jgi:hypothetical protein
MTAVLLVLVAGNLERVHVFKYSERSLRPVNRAQMLAKQLVFSREIIFVSRGANMTEPCEMSSLIT